jgi:hypothetical protein
MNQRSISIAGLILFAGMSWFTMPSIAQTAEVQSTFHVAPNGNDANPGTESKPFATIEKARQTVRSLNKKMTGDIVVLIHDGTYFLEQPLVFESLDSGMNGYDVIYQAVPGATPVISGGKRITDWQADANKRWKAATTIENFRQLYVDGKRAVRARGPAPKNLQLFEKDGYETTDIDIAGWRNPGDIELCYDVVWCHTRCKVQSIQREGKRAILRMAEPHFSQAKAKEGVNIHDVAPDHIVMENALELLNEPGEWYLDRTAKTVYYLPRPGEEMNKTEVIAPVLEQLVELRGTLEKPVQNIQFVGITFKHGGWLLPSQIGLVDIQANFRIDWKCPMERKGELTMTHNQHVKSPANVVCHAAKAIRFDRCVFTQLGGAGIDVEFGSEDNVISGCRFFDISGSAIQIGDVIESDHHPKDAKMIVKNNAVVNNYIHDVCVEHQGGVGVFAGYTEATTIAHNEIAQLPYSGISMGWGWGEEDAGGGNPDYEQPFKYDTPTPAKNNRIEYNHIHHVMLMKHDGGGIYTLGMMPGSVLQENYIHDNVGEPGGIYLDEGSGGIEVVGNRIENVSVPMNFNNHVQDRITTCNVHGNSFGKRSNATPDASEEDGFRKDDAKKVAEQSGLEPEYRDLLKP